ncbi:helix-turn-helix transcriptional regulator [Streptomyces mangrovisoli]|uniref:HTH luxR-type domain-containing protein n=1 Tax=Streptomyces mangrovisoli TaxID=1428628 RepID=A0A1J4P0Q3_9ACTN|nr:LuxR family transcriptional regulator [Streptomyces mangrovisoli]OIJ68184.1 hypothetical protein WN71_009080 [Streptomyces mangrovisoli]
MHDDPRDLGRPVPRQAADEGRSLVGRRQETAALTDALDDLATGRGRAVALTGEPGIGKSALIAAVVARARGRGIPVVSLADSPDSGGGGALPQGPVVVVADDLHRLPAERLRLVEQAVRGCAARPTLCLLAYRQRQLSAEMAQSVSLAVSGGLLDPWSLGPLSPAEAKELLLGGYGEAGTDADASQVEANAMHIDANAMHIDANALHVDTDALHADTAGNPLYLTALGPQGAARDRAVTAILGELAGLDTAALTLMRAAAVLEGPFEAELLAAVAGFDVPGTLCLLDELTRLDLVRPAEPAPYLTLRHRALAEVVYARTEPSLRHAMHRRAESALAGRAAAVTRRARHVARAADPERPDHVATLIAAARSELFGAPSVAVGHLETALTLLREDGPHWHEAHVLLARARMLSGNAREARALLDTLRSSIAGPGEAAALAESSRLERHRGQYTEAGAMARAGLAALTDATAAQDFALAAALHTELADHAYTVRDYDTSRHHAEKAAELARSHQDSVGEAHALAQAALASLFTGDQETARPCATRAAQLVDSAGDFALSTNLDALLQLGMTEGMLERLEDSERHLTRAAALSRRTGQAYIAPSILTVLANTQLRSGKLRRVLTTLDTLTITLDPDGAPTTAAIAAMVRAEALFWQDSASHGAAWRESAARAVELADGSQGAWAVSVRCFHAELAVRAGESPSARWLLLDAAGGEQLSSVASWRKPRWCEALARAAAGASDPDGATHWAELAESCANVLPSASRQGFAHRARMWARSATGDIDGALGSADEAVARFSASGERLETARTLLDAAGLALDAGRTEQVADRLERAGALAEQCGSAHLADESGRRREDLARRLAPPAATGARALLTEREREVAGLVSEGRTNHQVAQALFLSVRTVETHLGQIYRKLGVTNRAGLTRTLLAEGADGPA